MADGKLKNHLISIKICFFGFFITNPLSDFQKSRWWVQMTEEKSKNIQFWSILVYIWGFMISLIMNLPKNFRNSRWRIEYGGQKLENKPMSMQIGISGFSELRVTKKKKNYKNKKDGDKTATSTFGALKFTECIIFHEKLHLLCIINKIPKTKDP